MKKYTCILSCEAGIWTAHSPSVPGCYGVAKTKRAAIADLKSGIRDMLAYLADIGESLPVRRTEITTVEA